MWTEKQLAAIRKLEVLAAEKIKTLPDDFHNLDRMKLACVPAHVKNILESHDNPYCWSSVEGSRVTLLEVVKHFKFKLK